MSKFTELSEYVEQVKAGYSRRDSMYKELEDMFLLEASDLPDGDQVKETISPDARNALIGAVRLLSAAEPKWRVPYEINSYEVNEIASSMEVAAKSMWHNSSQERQQSIDPDLALMSLLYSEIHIAMNLTEDILKTAKGPLKVKAERMVKRTPIMFEPISAINCYPVVSQYGLSAHIIASKRRAVDVRARWGDAANKSLGDAKDFDTVEYREYWDFERHAAWIDGAKSSIFEEENKLGFIPISTRIMEGSQIFQRENQQTRQPFLYGLWKSGLWKRQNLSLTVLYTLIFSIGANPLYLYKRTDPNKVAPQVNHDVIGGVTVIDSGEEFSSLLKQVIDPSIVDGLNIADEKGMQSTIYKQTLGESLGSTAAYSMVALLTQSGKLPLVPYQKALSMADAEAMRLAFELIRVAGPSTFDFVSPTGSKTTLSKSDIPENFIIQADVDVSMPQDKRENLSMALQGTMGDNPLFSHRWARENLIDIEQSDEMDREIYQEKAAQLKLQSSILDLQLQVEMKKQQMLAMQQQQAAATVQGGMQGGMMPQGGMQGGQQLPQMPQGGALPQSGEQGVGAVQAQQRMSNVINSMAAGGEIGSGNPAVAPGEGQAQGGAVV